MTLVLSLRDFAPPDGTRSPRDALCWLPRASDVARIEALAAGARIIDVGAGSGLLSRLLADAGADVIALEPGGEHARGVGRFHAVDTRTAGEAASSGVRGAVAVVAFMEAGVDYRADVARLAPIIVSVRDIDGMCGVRGDQDYGPHGLALVDSWEVPNFEDVGDLIRLAGRGVPVELRGRVDVWATPERGTHASRLLRETPPVSGSYPWEVELDAVVPGPDTTR